MVEIIDEIRQFGPIEEGDEDLCRALWISVIVQAFIDAGGKSSKAGNRRDRDYARTWLAAESENSEFAIICGLADLPFRQTRTRILTLLESDHETLDFRCLTKAWGKAQNPESRNRFFTRARRNARLRNQAHQNLKAKTSVPAKSSEALESISA